MLKESSENYSLERGCGSDDLLFQKKYSRKTKTIKKKLHQMGMLPNKKKKCQLFDKGLCPKGAMCSFSHSFIPDIAKKLCKLFSINLCKKAELCPFSHNPSRFPCKSLFILGNCMRDEFCPFSHRPLDPDFYQDFFEDNLDFIADALEQNKILTNECVEFTKTIDVIGKRKKQVELQQQSRFPLYLGLAVTRSNSAKGSNHDSGEKSKPMKKQPSKKELKSEKIFSIRLASKNRQPIPESIFVPEKKVQKIPELIEQENLLWEPRMDQNSPSEKLSRCIELTPEERDYKMSEQQIMFNQSFH